MFSTPALDIDKFLSDLTVYSRQSGTPVSQVHIIKALLNQKGMREFVEHCGKHHRSLGWQALRDVLDELDMEFSQTFIRDMKANESNLRISPRGGAVMILEGDKSSEDFTRLESADETIEIDLGETGVPTALIDADGEQETNEGVPQRYITRIITMFRHGAFEIPVISGLETLVQDIVAGHDSYVNLPLRTPVDCLREICATLQGQCEMYRELLAVFEGAGMLAEFNYWKTLEEQQRLKRDLAEGTENPHSPETAWRRTVRPSEQRPPRDDGSPDGYMERWG